jgi:hypothetical protein
LLAELLAQAVELGRAVRRRGARLATSQELLAELA